MCQYLPTDDIVLPNFEGLSLELGVSKIAQAKFDLAFHFSDGESFAIEYMAEMFDSSTVARFASSLMRFLDEAIKDPRKPVATTPMLGENDMILLEQFSPGNIRPEYLSEPLVHQVFESMVASRPDEVCLLFGGRMLTFYEVNVRSNQLAQRLVELGVGKEVIVGVMLDRSFELIISILAILKAGGGYLPLDPGYPIERLTIYVEDAHASIVLTQTHLLSSAQRLAGDNAVVMAVDGLDLSEYSASNLAADRCDAEATSLILFTSGSTGRYVIYCCNMFIEFKTTS